MRMDLEMLDLVIVGAGLSGIGAAYRIQESCPNHSFTILEERDKIGGTWDLFKYPGIRSDSDMYTFGFPFFPWKDPKAIADGPTILQYINDTVDEFGLRKKIRFNRRLSAANWSDSEKCWTLSVSNSTSVQTETIRCKFLFMCSGYYDYLQGHEPEFKNREAFKGITVHPQQWDQNLDYAGKRVVIIGSGATAVTLLPTLAEKAEHVTMLQRSPTYILNLPSEDKLANFLKRTLPSSWAHSISRWKNILFGLWFYQACRKWPDAISRFLRKQIKKSLKDKYDDKHFNPKYKPWDQRLCLVPDNDMFRAIKKGKASIATDTIKQWTENGIELNSGKTLEADIIVTATGLKVQLFGGMKLTINDQPLDMANSPAFKGVMLSDVPNFAIAVGYTNASWTLKSDLNSRFVVKVLNHMKKNNVEVCVPRFPHETMEKEQLLDFNANYILRAIDILPKQGTEGPWKVHQNYLKDLLALGYGSPSNKYLEYT